MTRNFKRHLLATAATTLVVIATNASIAQEIGQNVTPTGSVVVRGHADISTSGVITTITQSSTKAIINWRDFSVGENATVKFDQNDANSVVLNRVEGDNASQIMGNIYATGKVFLVNRNGVIFGKNAVVNVAGLIATTANISDDNFWSGNYQFDQLGAPGASVVNNGQITIRDSGIATFVAPHVVNNGIITARLGRVSLAATDRAFSLDLYGDGLIKFAMTGERAAELGLGADSKLGVDMSGKILAEGGMIAITADLAREVVSDVITLNGEARASSITKKGGNIILGGGNGSVKVAQTATLDASGVEGGDIVISGGNVLIEGNLDASGDETVYQDELNYLYSINGPQGAIDEVASWSKGGKINIKGDVITLGGYLDATGSKGGEVNVSARNLMHYGGVYAQGAYGQGGDIALTASGSLLGTTDSVVAADGMEGGVVSLRGGAEEGGNMYYSGTISANGMAGDGGDIRVTAKKIQLVDAQMTSRGLRHGGQINVGFDGERSDPAIIADSIIVSPHSIFNASAGVSGHGGKVNFWSTSSTDFWGQVQARGGQNAGNGGFVEISSKGNIGYYGIVDAGADNGQKGTLLLDPKNLTVTTAVDTQYFHFTDPNPDAGKFGTLMLELANGNIVITDPEDDFAATNSGAVYLYDGTSYALISSLTGSSANDKIGDEDITALSNGNFVLVNKYWDNGAVTDAGAATWINGTTGLSGVISSTNSLVGEHNNDRVGFLGVTKVGNGNYVVISPYLDDGTIIDAGAVTWGDGNTGVKGVITSSNSLVGASAGDYIGQLGVTVLTNGNYVVISPKFRNGTNSHTGAITWGSGNTGISGEVSSTNSLVGSTNSDFVGNQGVFALTNGNYVVASSTWDNGTKVDAGAVTWGNGLGGTIGAVSSANSLVGTNTNYKVGSLGVIALTNGNYVVKSPEWNSSRGAATWGNGATGVTGAVSSSNSLVGSNSDDDVGSSVTALTNGNYVVNSDDWKNGSATKAGAVTWGNGATGISGAVSTSNSLFRANQSSYVGNEVIVLTNGNYVVISPYWENSLGAVTWGNGLGGTTGAVSSSNSLVGATAVDKVGTAASNFRRGVVALTNGNYVVISHSWDNGAVVDAGAVTWGNGSGGTVGVISSANSLVGTTAGDKVGSVGVTALTNGNYVIASNYWDNGAQANAGAVTWGNGATGTSGVVSSSNSLTSARSSSYVGGRSVIALTNGNYVVVSNSWNDTSLNDVGAVTWGNGTTGISGVISSANSLIGSQQNDRVGLIGTTDYGEDVLALSNGNYVVRSQQWKNGTTMGAGAVTWADGSTGLSGYVTSSNSLVGITSDYDFVGNQHLIERADGSVMVPQQLFSTTGRASILIAPNVGSVPVSFGTSVGQNLVVTPDMLTATLNTGTDLILQASNDLTVASVVTANNTGGDGGALTLQAGRSILINANITTDNGDLTLIANETAANGVVDSDRAAGAAHITMASGTTIDVGTGVATITLSTGAGNTNSTSGDITLETVTGGKVLVTNNGGDAGAVTLNDVITATNTGDAIIMRTNGAFTNAAGASALTAASGRYLVFVKNYGDITKDGLNATSWYNTAVNAAASGVTSTADKFVINDVAVLSVTADDKSKTYGDSNSALTQTISGYVNGETSAILSGSVGTASSTVTTTTNAGTVTITADAGTLATDNNYTINTVDGTFTVNKKTVTVTAASDSKTYDGSAYTGGSGITYSNDFINGDTSTVVTETGLGYTGTSQGATNAGSYEITASGLTSTNYDFTYIDGGLAVNKAALTVTANNQTTTYGDGLGTTAFTNSVLIGTESIDAVTLSSGFTDVGSYIGGLIASVATGSNGFLVSNYNITYAAGDLTVSKKILTVTATGDNKTYDGLG
ncbi:MAG: filamentous hemagglutinin N-terminal domain-containing protein, partial [Emcibacter sp.]|nr:filamentous hemagglutinin N-terminal domain-containing protein [Emcibacter sp.]